jgi:hypothetical protein
MDASVVIEGVHLEIDCSRILIKRVVGEGVMVEADIFSDGHDSVSCPSLLSFRYGARPAGHVHASDWKRPLGRRISGYEAWALSLINLPHDLRIEFLLAPLCWRTLFLEFR